MEIQADEYGGGRPDRIHATMFARSMEALGLDSTAGRLPRRDPRPHARDGEPDVAVRPPPAPARSDRRPPRAVRDDLLDPESALRSGLRRLGLGEQATAFFDEHVEADAVHENIAAVDLAGGLARQQPALGPDMLWGARCLAALDARWAAYVLGAWEAGETSLRAAARAWRPSDRGLAPVLEPRGRPEVGELVCAVAERANPGAPAAAERHRLALHQDLAARACPGGAPGPRTISGPSR